MSKKTIFEVDFLITKGIEKFISNILKTIRRKKLKVIDYGCGNKPYRNLFPSNSDYIGLDIFPGNQVDILIKPNDRFKLKKKIADIVLSTQVIHKLESFDIYFKNIRHIMRDDGILIITSHGNWTYHPMGSGDYYRFTQDGLRSILRNYGFKIKKIEPIIGTLGSGLHIRQIVFNAWLKKIPVFGLFFMKVLNLITNLRIIFEEMLQTRNTKMSNPTVFAILAIKKNE